MMYLFKGLDITTNKIVEGHFIRPYHTDDSYVRLVDVEQGVEFKVDSNTVTTFTGYCDTNGKQIFTQDICVDDELGYVCRIGFDGKLCKFGIYVNAGCIGSLTENVAQSLRVINSVYACLGEEQRKEIANQLEELEK